MSVRDEADDVAQAIAHSSSISSSERRQTVIDSGVTLHIHDVSRREREVRGGGLTGDAPRLVSDG